MSRHPASESSVFQAHPVLQAVQSLRKGGLAVTLPGGEKLLYDGTEPGMQADLCIYDRKALDYIASYGDIGFGEGYMLGLWDTADLQTLMWVLAENVEAIESCIRGASWSRFLYFLRNKFRPNTYLGSKNNIHMHYDMGNDFYRLWLDETLSYSCALFNGDPGKSLEEAQRAKYRRILSRLSPSPSDHILEIGCGWGGFMEAAAKDGHRVTGITISPAQAELAEERMAEAGLGALTEVRLQDYREIRETYDHVVSIGMFEHVGEAFWPDYMKKMHDALKPSGKAVLQTIVIRDDLFGGYRKSSDFIREHIFPGVMLPSPSRLAAEAGKAGFRIGDVFRFGRDYAITLEKWLERFDDRLLEISGLGYDEEFIRKWRLYLTSCAAMFRIGRIDVLQVELCRS